MSDTNALPSKHLESYTKPEDTQREFAAASDDVDEVVKVHLRSFVVVAAINFAYFGQLVITIGSGFLAQPLGQLFNGSDRTVWLSTVINILITALCPPISQAADYWGRKWFLVGTQACAFAGSIIVSRADSMNTVIAGFVVLGISCGTQSLSFSVVSEILPRRYRPHAQLSLNVSATFAAVIGICMGGALVRNGDLENYRTYFYFAAAIFAAATAAVVLCYNPPARDLQKSLTTKEKLRRLDWIGYFLLTPGVILLCMALAWSQNPYSWDDVHILAPFIIGVAMLAAFCVYEWRFRKDGMVHHGLFKDRNYPLSLVTIFVEGLVFFTLNSYYAFEVSVFQGADLLMSGLHFMIMFLTTLVSACITASLSKRYKVVRFPIFAGFICFLVMFIVLATVTPRSDPNGFWAYTIVGGVGMGIILPLIVVAGQLSTTPELISIGTGLIVSVRALGATVGLAVNNAIVNGALSDNLVSKITDAALALGLPPSSLSALIPAVISGDPAAMAKVPGVTAAILSAAGAGYVEAFHIAFRNAWIASACFVCVAIVASWFFFDPKDQFNDHIDAPAEPVPVRKD